MLRRIHGSKDHSSVAASLYSLGLVYLAQGRLDDSASLHEEVLAMARRIHGSKDQQHCSPTPPPACPDITADAGAEDG